MNRRRFFALVSLPFLGRWIPHQRGTWNAVANDWSDVEVFYPIGFDVRDTPTGSLTFDLATGVTR